MQLVSLSMRNFKKYRHADLEFQNGLIGIVGSNGAGKSTIVDAIAWALYGSKASTIKRELIRNAYAKENEPVEVKLGININNQDYIIYRAMKGKGLSPEAKLFSGIKVIAFGSSEVDQKIGEILRISFDDFMKTFYARQKDLDNLLKEGGIGKREYLLKLLGLEDIRESAIEKIKSDQNGLNDQKNRLSGALDQIGDVDKHIEEVSDLKESAQTEFSICRDSENRLVSEVKTIKFALDQETEKKRNHGLLMEKIASLESQISEKKAIIEADKDRLREIESYKAAIADLEPKLQRLKAVRKRLDLLEPKRKEYAIVSQKTIKTSTELDGAFRVFKDLEQMLITLFKYQSALEEIESLELEYQEITNQYSQLEEERDRNTELQSSLKEEKVRLESLENNLIRTESAMKLLIEAKARLMDLASTKKNYEILQSQFQEAFNQKELQAKLDNLKDQRASIVSNNTSLTDRIKLLDKKISSLGDLDAKETKIKIQDFELDKLQSALLDKITELKSDLKVYEAKKTDSSRGLSKIGCMGPDSICPTCERSLGDQHVHLVKKYEIALDEAERQIVVIKETIGTYTEKINGVISTRSNFKKVFEDLNVIKREKAELLAESRSLESQILENTSHLKAIDLDIEALGTVKFEPERFKEMQIALNDMAPLLQEYRLMESKVQDLPLKEKELDVLHRDQIEQIKIIQGIQEHIQALGFNEACFLQKKTKLQQLRPIHERFQNLSEKIKEIPAFEARIKSQTEEIERLKRERSLLDDTIAHLDFDPQEDESLRYEHKNLSKAEDLAQQHALKVASEGAVKGRLQETKDALVSLEFNLNKEGDSLLILGYVEENYLDIKKALEQTEELLENARKNLSDKEVRLAVLDGELEKLLIDARRKKDCERDLLEISRRLQVVDTTKSLINRFMDYILIKKREEISSTASGILRDVSTKYDTLSIDDDFNIMVHDNGKPYPISRYSGGEIDMIAVSVRVAISEHLMSFCKNGPGCSFLILDEIFGSQDLEHRDNMLDMLRKLQDRFPQIIVISHFSDVQGQFDNTINVIEDEMGNSRVEVV